jgi:hypothetical protein
MKAKKENEKSFSFAVILFNRAEGFNFIKKKCSQVMLSVFFKARLN